MATRHRVPSAPEGPRPPCAERSSQCVVVLAARVGVDPSTIVAALARLRECGFLSWLRRLVRDRNRVEQTSNAYVLTVPGPPDLERAWRDWNRENSCESGV